MRKIFPLFLLAALLFPLISYAGLVPCGPGTGGAPYCTLCHFFVLIANIYEFIIKTIVPSLAGLMVAVAGFFYVTAFFGEGGANAVGKGGAVLKAAVIGILIAYGSWLIVHTVFFVLGVNPQFLGSWNTINCTPGTPGAGSY